MGMAVDRATGVITWTPLLFQVDAPQQVTVLAVDTGTARQTFYRFTVTARATTVLNRVDLDSTAPASSGLQDASGLFMGLTTRLAGTGTALPALDPNLNLNATNGVLELSTTQADFFGGAGLANASCPGISLAQLGLTGAGDFSITTVFKPLPALEFIDQVGVYVGASKDALTRAGTIVFGAPERYSTHSENGADHSGHFFGFGLDGSDGMTVTITRQAGAWRYFIDGLEWNPSVPPTFLDGRTDLVAGVFAITPLNPNRKTVQIDSVSVIVATSQPLP